MPGKLFETISALARPPLGQVLLTPGQQQGQRLRVLVVDDSATDRQIALALLRRLGQDAHAVPDGMSAAVGAANYDVILMDVSMPGMDGLEATRRIVQAKPHPRIVAMTGGRMAGPDACEAAGMQGYLSKPVRLDQLAETLRAEADAMKQ